MNASTTPPETTTDGESAGLSRRTVIGTAAWAAPAIAFTTASPANATSLGTLSVDPAVITVSAGTPTVAQLRLDPAGNRVPIALTVEPEGAVTFPSEIVSVESTGKAEVSLSTDLPQARLVTATAVAPGYAPLIFTINVEAPAALGTISLIEGPRSVSVDTSPSDPFTLGLEPIAAGVPVTLRSAPAEALTFSSTSPGTDSSGRTSFTVSTAIESESTADIIAAAPGYGELTIPLLIPAKSTMLKPEIPVNGGDVRPRGGSNQTTGYFKDGRWVITQGTPGRPLAFDWELMPRIPKGETATVQADFLTVDDEPIRFALDKTEWTVNGGFVQTGSFWLTRTSRTFYQDLGCLFIHYKGSGFKVFFDVGRTS